MQKEEDSLVAVNKAADRVPNTAGMGFFRWDGLLYRRWQPPGQDSELLVVEQLVLPQACRPNVLALAHTIPLAGHLGKDKTAWRVLQWFYWPTLFRDVVDYCKHCADCQRAGNQRVRRVPLVPLPVIGEPFAWIAMDIVGSLPRSWAGHKYILVVCDYATPYQRQSPGKPLMQSGWRKSWSRPFPE